MSSGARKVLKTLIGTYPHTEPLKSGALRSDAFDLEFTEIVPVWDGFKGMIRDDKYEVSEMAVVTYLLAKAHGRRLALLPAAMICLTAAGASSGATAWPSEVIVALSPAASGGAAASRRPFRAPAGPCRRWSA